MSISPLFKDFKRTDPKKALLVTFEGIEGSGKSTQIQKFSNYLSAKGKTVHLFREPGATNLGEKLRQCLLGSNEKIDPMAQALVFCAARAQLLTQKVLPLLDQKENIIILDRYFDSTFAYQGEAGQLGIENMIKLHQVAPLNLLPHLTFYLAIDIETSMQRQNKRGQEKDYFESQNQNFYQKVISGYEKMAQLDSSRIRRIDAGLNEEEVFQSLCQNWEEHFG